MVKLELGETIETAMWKLWVGCLTSARTASVMADVAGVVLPSLPEAVQNLIAETREIIREQGFSQEDSDIILFGLYTNVHWEWDQPTDRVFETLLEFELEKFFSERKVS